MVVSGFLAGLFVPLSLFPGWLHAVAYLTPFPAVMMTPIDVLTGTATDADAWLRVGEQMLWLTGLLLLGQALTRAGRRKLEVQGG